MHPDSEEIIDKLKPIFWYQINVKWFENILLILAIIPFDQIFPGTDPNSLQMFKLIRLLRLDNDLLPEAQLLQFARFFYTGKSRSREEKIYKDDLVKNMIKIVKLIILTIAMAYFLACFWFRVNTYYLTSIDTEAFMASMELSDHDDKKTRLIRMCYYALTTLSTVGYGDYSPGAPDREPNSILILGSIILISGVTFFSTLTSTFIDIIQNIKL